MRGTIMVAVLAIAATAVPVFAGQGMSHEITVSQIDNEQYLPSVTYNWKRDEYLVVWHNSFFNGRDVYGRRVDRFGEVLSEFTISSGLDDRAQPSVAYDWVNDRYLVVYTLDVFGDGSDWDVWGRFIDWNGPNPAWTEFPICTWTSSQWNPKVEYGRTQQEFMVVWTSTPTAVPAYISARRVFADMSGFPPGDGFTVSSGAENRVNPEVAYNLARNEYLFTYDLVTGGATGIDIWAARFTASGSILGSEFGVAGWPADEQHPDVAACHASDSYLVVWQSEVGANDQDVYGRFVTGGGVVDGAPLLFDRTSIDESEPAVECMRDSDRFMVAFQQEFSSSGAGFGIRAQGVLSSHQILDLFDVRPLYQNEQISLTAPVIAGGEAGWMVAWEHDRPSTAYQDIHARSVWDVFGSGFESGNLSGWSTVTP